MSPNPAVPTFIFRGHASAIHALHFYNSNLYLASGDSEGWIVIWSLATKRPQAVWKGHNGAIMGLRNWGPDRLISHGRDHSFRVWHLKPDKFDNLSKMLPVDGAKVEDGKQPWLLHSMAANALNYCAFSMCVDVDALRESNSTTENSPVLIATPNGLDASGIDLFQLPSEQRVCKITSTKDSQLGMVMAVSVFVHPSSNRLTLISGYENGEVVMHIRSSTDSTKWRWQATSLGNPHSQPVLSLSISKDRSSCITSSADAIIAKFESDPDKEGFYRLSKVQNTKHAGQQDVKIRDDDKILATAGWDKRVRVYSVKTLRELAVLKWHQEGCFAIDFAVTSIEACVQDTGERPGTSLIKTTVELLKAEREAKAQKIHYLVAGGKDGKISLWEIY